MCLAVEKVAGDRRSRRKGGAEALREGEVVCGHGESKQSGGGGRMLKLDRQSCRPLLLSSAVISSCFLRRHVFWQQLGGSTTYVCVCARAVPQRQQEGRIGQQRDRAHVCNSIAACRSHLQLLLQSRPRARSASCAARHKPGTSVQTFESLH